MQIISRSGMPWAALLTMLLCVSAFAQQQPAQEPEQPGREMSLSMDEAVKLGQERSFALNRVRRSDEIAGLQYENAQSLYWPRAELDMNINESERYAQSWYNGFGITSSPYSTFQAGPSAYASMPIDLFGTIGHSVKLSELSRKQTSLQATQSSIDVITAVRTAYIDALKVQGAVDADEAAVDDIQALMARAQSQEVKRFLAVELANAQQTLSNDIAAADLSQSSLKQQLRLPQETILKLTTKLDPNIPVVVKETLASTALAQRPDMKQAQLRYELAQVVVDQAYDSRKPSIYVTAYYNGAFIGSSPGDSWRDKYQSAAVILNVNIPIAYFDHGQLDNNARIAMLTRDQAQDDIQEQKERVQIELRQLVIGLDQAQSRLRSLPSPEIAHDALARAEDALVGSSSANQLAQVTNARNSWRLAQTASIDALADYYSAYYNLKRAIGEQ